MKAINKQAAESILKKLLSGCVDTSGELKEMSSTSLSELYKYGPQICHSCVERKWKVRKIPNAVSQ